MAVKEKLNELVIDDKLIARVQKEVDKRNGVTKRGSKSASLEDNCTASKAEIGEIIRNSLRWYGKTLIKSDEECAERLNEYFQVISQTGEIPTVEKMCLALGTVRATVFDWERGTQGSARSDMIKKAKELLASLDAELVSRGKIPQITYIFRAKNFFDMSDKQEMVLTPNNPLGAQDDPGAIQKRLLQSVPDEDPEG